MVGGNERNKERLSFGGGRSGSVERKRGKSENHDKGGGVSAAAPKAAGGAHRRRIQRAEGLGFEGREMGAEGWGFGKGGRWFGIRRLGFVSQVT